MCPRTRAGGHVIRAIAVIGVLVTLAIVTTPARASSAKLRPDVIAYWQGPLHNCEQPSGWHGGFPRYPGGLGIYEPNWRWAAGELGLLRRYPNGASAPVLVQIRVADYGYRAHRWYWSCFASVGYPPR